MKKNTVMTIVMVLLAFVVVGALVLSLNDVISSVFSGTAVGGGMTYQNAEKYTAGETVLTDNVRNLDVDWINGEVNLAYHSENTIELRETSNKEISPELEMRWWIDGDTLRIRFAKNGFKTSNLKQEKKLTITLPEGIVFGKVSIDVTSATVNIPALQADSLYLDATSGNLNAEGSVKEAEAGTTSGRIALKMLAEEMDKIQAEATSGSIEIEAQHAKKINVSTTSGAIGITAQQAENCDASATSGRILVNIGAADEVSISTTSGAVDVTLGAFKKLDVGVTSGNVTLTLPQKPGFTAEIETTSGDIEYSMPLSKQDDSYVCGDGSGKVSVAATSGDVLLK